MQPSMFNVSVPLPGRDELFLMNTLTDAQLVVSSDVGALLNRLEAGVPGLSPEEEATVAALAEHGFVVDDRAADRQSIEQFFQEFREDRTELRVTLLTTMQCNFACDYCIQGDHGDYNKHAHKMSLETAARTADWIESRLGALESSRLVLTFFGGEPLLNLPVVYYLAERLWKSSQARGVTMLINIITNGLLLTREVVDRLKPCGLNGIKITLDGDRDAHDRMRPLRGGQGTFDRIIRNIRDVADDCKVSIGGNFDASSVESFPALLDFLKAQAFSDKLAKVVFKPIIAPQPSAPKNIIPLTAIGASGKPLNGACMTGAGGGGSSPCDTCHFVEEKASFLREETKRRGFPTIDGVHMGPCEIHRKHAYTIGPDGTLFSCPGFAGEQTQATGHIDDRKHEMYAAARERFETLAAWEKCDDCSFIPVCAGGCSVASHNELGDMNTPTCHRASFESALISFATDVAGTV
jgi:uncharacterized protein